MIVEDYDIGIARHLVSGCDVWVNLPRKPMEASGTSGMKATFNGALQLSVLDGWWAEGYNGDERLGDPRRRRRGPGRRRRRATRELFYDLLEHEVIPLFYDRDADGVPQRLVRPDQGGARHARAGVHGDADGQRLRRADLPRRARPDSGAY